MSGPHPAISIRNVSRHYSLKRGIMGKPRHLRAVDGVSLNVDYGEVLGIVGESGCGKSTLAKLVMGLETLGAGEILVDGRSIATMDRRERAQLIQMVFQDPFSSLNPTHRLHEIVGLPLRVQGNLTAGEIERKVDAVLERVGLPGTMRSRYATQLSGGQRQRVAIARALVSGPRILVCDEPTSALDVSVQAQILNLLDELRADLGLTMLFISHNLAVVRHVSTKVAVMYLGRVVELARADTLFAGPRHPYTQALLEAVLTPDPSLGPPDLRLGTTPPDPANVPEGCRFHPRCAVARPVCASNFPQAKAGSDHTVECLFADGDPAETVRAVRA